MHKGNREFFAGLALVGLTAALSSSCVVLSPKKYKGLLGERDSLMLGLNRANTTIDSLQREANALRNDTARLNARVGRLGNQYTQSSAELNKLGRDLAAREKRLKEVEDVLRARDAATTALRNKLREALLGFEKNGLAVDVRDGKVYVSLTDKLLFATGSIVIDDKGKQALAELAKVLKQQQELNIAVEGHTDNKAVNNLGQIKDNWDLSVLRATSVVRYLTETEKVPDVRFTATGRGQWQPIADNATVEGRSKNRRIEIVLAPKLDELYNLLKK